MNEINYDKIMQEEIKNLGEKKPTLLLHSCCAPCSSSVIERLKENFRLTVFYYNPNIDDNVEYEKRLIEQKRFCNLQGVNFLEGEHDVNKFYDCVIGLEKEAEGGARCFKCYRLRLEETAKEAQKKGFDYFTTTLSVSPLKNAKKINEIGEELGKIYGVKFLNSDFKKRNGYVRSIELSKQNGLYRQNYCGCGFSKRQTEF